MVLFVGEVLADLITEEPFESAENFVLRVGGSPGNIAKFLAQLGIPTRMLARVGNDPIGKRIVNNLSKRGVDVSHIQYDDLNATTLVFVQRTKLTPDFFVVRGADRFLESPNDEVFDGVKIVHFSCWPFTVSPIREVALDILERVDKLGIKLGFDPNCREKLFPCGCIDMETIRLVLGKAEIIKPSVDDAIALFGQYEGSLEDKVRYYVDKFHQCGVKKVVLTAGPYGAFASENGDIQHIPTYATNVVDATGAGDGFWAGLYYGILKGQSLFDACCTGSKIAAQVLSQIGADVEVRLDA